MSTLNKQILDTTIPSYSINVLRHNNFRYLKELVKLSIPELEALKAERQLSTGHKSIVAGIVKYFSSINVTFGMDIEKADFLIRSKFMDIEELLDQQIDEVELTIRLSTKLKGNNIYTVRDLVRANRRMILSSCKTFTRGNLNEIKEFIEEHDIADCSTGISPDSPLLKVVKTRENIIKEIADLAERIKQLTALIV